MLIDDTLKPWLLEVCGFGVNCCLGGVMARMQMRHGDMAPIHFYALLPHGSSQVNFTPSLGVGAAIDMRIKVGPRGPARAMELSR